MRRSPSSTDAQRYVFKSGKDKMLSDEFLRIEKENLTALGGLLHKEALFMGQFLEMRNPKNEKEWAGSVRSDCIYGTFLIKNLLDTIDSHRELSEEQMGFYIGKIAIQSFLDIINSFEQSTNKLVSENAHLSDILRERINKKKKIIEKNWDKNSGGKSKKVKDDLLRYYDRKIFEMQFIRDSLFQKEIIDDLDKKILEFVWNIRNSMHSNFVAIRDIEFSAPGTSLNYSFSFKKGEELYHPHDLVSFYTMTEQIIFIQIKILQYFNKLAEK